jgi:CheY-like chemotaxis protein
VDTESDPRLVSKHDLSEGRYGVVEIADSGSGIPAEVLSRVTEPFFTTKNRAEGSGLGLSMALGFARQSGGNLVVESTHKSGTTVKVFFPLVDQPVEKAAEPEQSAHFGHQTQVLLLEDDYTVQAMLRAQLQNVGFKVTTLETGKQALQALECSVFDIAILDNIVSGNLTGIDTAKRIQELDRVPKTVLLSGMVGTEIDEISPLFDAILHKPVQFRDLLAAIIEISEPLKSLDQ